MKYFIFISLLFSTSLYAQLDEQITKLEQDELIEQQTIDEYKKVEQPKIEIEVEKEIVEQQSARIHKKQINQNSEQNSSIGKKKVSKLQNDFARQQMLRKARFLRKKYKDALIKLDNWENKKEALINSFQKRYAKEETSFGDGNAYGKERARKRKEKFYRSLDVEEHHIQERVAVTEAKLRQLEEEFLFKFSVSLKEAEASGVKTPVIKDKEQKVQMINEYLNENEAWKQCWNKVAEFEKLQNVANSIEKLFPESQLTETYISSKSKQNQEEMQEHIRRYQSIDEEYKEKYGISLKNDSRAKMILENINSY
jgi:hypothetical protein